jgi:preprotein translocase subunit SecF
MTKTSKILFIIWIMLAIACFVGAFFTPVVWAKVIGLVFGGMNSLIILTWILTAIQGVIENKKLNSGE